MFDEKLHFTSILVGILDSQIAIESEVSALM